MDAVFIMIKSNSPVQLISFLNYVEKYYIGTLKQGSKSCRNQPMFSKEIWNVHERTIKDLPRTNNSLESWHKQFASDIRAHPSVNMIIEKFRIEQKNMENSLKQVESGDVYKRKRSEVFKDSLIRNELLNYKRELALKVLDKISLISRNNS